MTATVTIDPASTIPPYDQLRRQLTFQIRSGFLATGNRLPTVRQLARDLGISKNTVVRAYSELEQQGLVIGAGRNGTIVTERIDSTDDRTTLITEAARRFLADISTLEPTIDELVATIQQIATASPPIDRPDR